MNSKPEPFDEEDSERTSATEILLMGVMWLVVALVFIAAFLTGGNKSNRRKS